MVEANLPNLQQGHVMNKLTFEWSESPRSMEPLYKESSCCCVNLTNNIKHKRMFHKGKKKSRIIDVALFYIGGQNMIGFVIDIEQKTNQQT